MLAFNYYHSINLMFQLSNLHAHAILFLVNLSAAQAMLHTIHIWDLRLRWGGVSGLGKWKLGGKIMWKVEIRG